MQKMRKWASVAALVLAFASTGCMQLVRQWELDRVMEPVHATLEDHDARISAHEDMDSGAMDAVESLRSDLEALQRDFGAHMSDDDMHGGFALTLPLHFDFDSSEIRSVDQPILDAFVGAVNRSGMSGAHVTVEGSADQSGSDAYNMRLSQERAEAVRDYLVGEGLNSDNIRVVALGESRLVSDATGSDDTASGLENRRVTLVLEWSGSN